VLIRSYRAAFVLLFTALLVLTTAAVAFNAYRRAAEVSLGLSADIIDQMSANGTFVNGQKSTISYLQNGDKLRFAQVECEIRLPAGEGARSTARQAGGLSRSIIIAVGVALVTGLLLFAASRFL